MLAGRTHFFTALRLSIRMVLFIACTSSSSAPVEPVGVPVVDDRLPATQDAAADTPVVVAPAPGAGPVLPSSVAGIAPGAATAMLIELRFLKPGCEVALVRLPVLARSVVATLPDCPDELILAGDGLRLVAAALDPAAPGHLVELASRTVAALPPLPGQPLLENPDSWSQHLVVRGADVALWQSWGLGPTQWGEGPHWATTEGRSFVLRGGAWVVEGATEPIGLGEIRLRAGENAPGGTWVDDLGRVTSLNGIAGLGATGWNVTLSTPLLAWPTLGEGEGEHSAGPVLISLAGGWSSLPGSEAIAYLHLETREHYAIVGQNGASEVWDLRGPTLAVRDRVDLWFWPSELPIPVTFNGP